MPPTQGRLEDDARRLRVAKVINYFFKLSPGYWERMGFARVSDDDQRDVEQRWENTRGPTKVMMLKLADFIIDNIIGGKHA